MMRSGWTVVGWLSLVVLVASAAAVLNGLLNPREYRLVGGYRMILGGTWTNFPYLFNMSTGLRIGVPIFVPLAVIAASGTLVILWRRARVRDPQGFPVERAPD